MNRFFKIEYGLFMVLVCYMSGFNMRPWRMSASSAVVGQPSGSFILGQLLPLQKIVKLRSAEKKQRRWC